MANAGGTFVELQRKFRELDPKAGSEDAALFSLDLFFDDGKLGWEDLLSKRRVVVLGEAGSGKTREFRERAALLTQRDQFAVFIQLDQLISQPISAALENHS